MKMLLKFNKLEKKASKSEESKTKWKKIKKRLFIGFLAFTVLLVISVIIFDSFTTLKMEAALKLIRKGGEPLSPADFALESIPDKENAYYFYKRAFVFLPDLNEGEESKFFEDIKVSIYDLPSSLQWNLNRKEEIRKFLNENTDIFKYLVLALKRPNCVYPVEWEKGFGVELPHLQKMQSCIFLSLSQALFLIEEKKYQEATELMAASYHLARSIHKEPSTFSMSYEAYLSNSILKTAFWISSHHEPMRPLLYKRFSEFPTLDWKQRCIKSLQAERAALIDVLLDLLEGKYGNAAEVFNYGKEDKPFTLIDCLIHLQGTTNFDRNKVLLKLLSTFPFFVKPFVKLDLVYYLEDMEKNLDYASLTTWQGYSSLKKQKPNLYKWKSFGFCSYFSVSPDYEYELCLSQIARERTFFLTLGAKEYLVQKERLPNNLVEISKTLTIPIEDPYTGQPYQYKKEGKSFSIYSIGGNLKDDANKNDRLREDDIGWKWWNEFPKFLKDKFYRGRINGAILMMNRDDYAGAESAINHSKEYIPRNAPAPIAMHLNAINKILTRTALPGGEELELLEANLKQILQLLKESNWKEPQEFARKKLRWVQAIKDYKNFREKATQAYNKGDYEAAIKSLKETIKNSDILSQGEYEDRLKKWRIEYLNLLLDESKDLMKQNNFKQAYELLTKVKRLNLGDHNETEKLLLKCKETYDKQKTQETKLVEETLSQKHYELAQKAYKAGQYQTALSKLAKIKKATSIYSKANELKKEIYQLLVKQEILLNYQTGNGEEALRLIKEVENEEMEKLGLKIRSVISYYEKISAQQMIEKPNQEIIQEAARAILVLEPETKNWYHQEAKQALEE